MHHNLYHTLIFTIYNVFINVNIFLFVGYLRIIKKLEKEFGGVN